MSVLIKGMEMPPNCYLCHFVFRSKVNERVFCTAKEPMFDISETLAENRADDCPLKELPPHGRLIDADTLMETFRERKRPTLSDGEDGSKERVRYIDFISTLQAIKDAPTIIPAEEETE